MKKFETDKQAFELMMTAESIGALSKLKSFVNAPLDFRDRDLALAGLSGVSEAISTLVLVHGRVRPDSEPGFGENILSFDVNKQFQASLVAKSERLIETVNSLDYPCLTGASIEYRGLREGEGPSFLSVNFPKDYYLSSQTASDLTEGTVQGRFSINNQDAVSCYPFSEDYSPVAMQQYYALSRQLVGSLCQLVVKS